MSKHHSNFFVATDGDLCSKAMFCEVIREKYAYHHNIITNGKELCATLRAGEYAWPGGYPLFIGNEAGETLHFKCARENLHSLIHDLRHDHRSTPFYCEINHEDTELYCDHCGEKIESAYGENGNG